MPCTSCHNPKKHLVSNNKQETIKNLLIGAPNVGKSTFFNRITWQHSPVGNIDKVTVSSNLGTFKYDKNIKFLDLPGVYNLTPITKEEEVVINNLFNKNYDKVVNIVSITSLRRDLLLTIELLESDRLSNLIINMIDEWDNNNLNAFSLVNKLGVNASLISSTKNKNIKLAVNDILNFNNKKQFKLTYSQTIESLINEIESLINFDSKVSKRFIAIQVLNDNWFVKKYLSDNNVHIDFESLLAKYNITQDELINSIRDSRTKFIDEVCDKFLVVDEQLVAKRTKKEFRENKFDKLLMNKWFGIFMFVLVILAVYYLTFGNYAGGWINEVWTGLLEAGQDAAFEAINNTNIANHFWVAKFVSDGLLGGIFTVIGFLPYIMIMYFLITILEHSGFLARMSVLLDKTLDKFGLSGRSVITLFTGVGCNIPAIMMARNSQSKKERVILILITPLIACSARLVVYEWILQQLLPNNNFIWLITLALTMFSGLIAILVGYFFSNTLFRKQNNFFMTELPKWRAPHIKTILKGMGIEVWNFIKRVLTIILIVNLIIFFLLYISPTNGLINSESTESMQTSLLYYISLPFQYLFYPIGLGEDWRLSISLLAAAPAKELASSNLEILFGENGFHNFLFSANSTISAPISTSISYLLFFSFYVPCVATIVVMKKEAGWKWTLIHLLTAFVVAYSVSLCFYSFSGVIEKIANAKVINIKNSLAIIAICLLSVNVVLTLTIIINQIVFSYKTNISNRFVKYKSIFWKISLIFIVLSSILVTFTFLSLKPETNDVVQTLMNI